MPEPRTTPAATIFVIHGRRVRQWPTALISDAAVQNRGGADSLSRAGWLQKLNVDLPAPFLWTQALLSVLEQDQCCVANISSIHARLTKLKPG